MRRWRPLTWFLLSLLCFVGAVCFWQMGEQWRAEKVVVIDPAVRSKTIEIGGRPTRSESTAPTLPAVLTATNAPATNRFAHRLHNTDLPVGKLLRNDNAILLENALIDTTKPLDLSIPPHLKSQGDPGSYIVQSHGVANNAFRSALRGAGGIIGSYIPNNAYLVRLSAGNAESLSHNPLVQSVIRFEPYFKLRSQLLGLAVDQKPLPAEAKVHVLVFEDARAATVAQLEKMGAQIVSETRSPFGPVLIIEPSPESLPRLAQLTGVQLIEPHFEPVAMNDLARARVRVATDPVTNNYLDLTGSNVLININDTGVSFDHPDFASGRLTYDNAGLAVDDEGHGTHVAGIIAGNGSKSGTVTNAQGSPGPPYAPTQFRGMAPNAHLFVGTFRGGDHSHIQAAAARTNALISNNSWGFVRDYSYDLFAASYDAAVRDALPEVQGSQPVLFVFSAGNDGSGGDGGLGGQEGTVTSPATAKNVISVGAIEQPRFITNVVAIGGVTNQIWLSETDTNNQVAAFSSRGNVGIGIEGDAGRFKPDVVAPGVFVASTRSTTWDTNAYSNPTNSFFGSFEDDVVDPDSLINYSIFIPPNTVRFDIFAIASDPAGVDLPIYLRQSDFPTTNVFDFLGTNFVSLPSNLPLIPDELLYFSVGNSTNVPVRYSVFITLVLTNDFGDYYLRLQDLNNELGPWYRYESGTSMAAPVVSGTLALMQEFFEQRLAASVRNSPALMKALLINGARSVNPLYDFEVRNGRNYQGWGLVNLTNSIPRFLITNSLAPNPTNAMAMVMIDQSPTNALATAQSKTYYVSISGAARNNPLRITLTWTDPPGNPIAGVKLVNDLDLVVTNLDTLASEDGPLVYFGNDILAGNLFNLAWDTNSPAPSADGVNNVENVYLVPTPSLGSQYSITVVGHSVNVNAVTAHPDDVVQDYALVISSGNGQVASALLLTSNPVVATNGPNATVLTNSLTGSGVIGGLLSNQRIGASSPIRPSTEVGLGTNTVWPGTNGIITLGEINQWRFYVLTNSAGYTNAAFIVTLPPTLSVPRQGVNADDTDDATRFEADIDLYVSTNSALLSLDPTEIAAAQKSVGREGTESIVLTNAVAGVYYIGVKCEDRQAAEFSFLGAFAEAPFFLTDSNGNLYLRGINVPAPIPDGTPAHPGVANIFAASPINFDIRRVIVTNIMTHENFGDLIGILRHNRRSVVLNNHSFPPGDPPPTTNTFVYEDNDEQSVPGSRRTDGPGRLTDFIGEPAGGVWTLTEADNALGHGGQVDNLFLKIEPHKDTNIFDIPPGGIIRDAVNIPPEATNFTIIVENLSAAPGPIELYVRRDARPLPPGVFDHHKTMTILPADSLTIDRSSIPPLNAGRYHIVFSNPNATSQQIRVIYRVLLDISGITPVNFAPVNAVPLIDDAVTYATNSVDQDQKIARVDVGVAINHPRVSDLAVTLISPHGTRVLLSENRGGLSTEGMGAVSYTTNTVPVASNGSNAPSTTVIPISLSQGTLWVDYDFLQAPDSLDVVYDGATIFQSGMVSGAGRFTIPFGPGNGTDLTLIVNAHGNTNTDTIWQYTATVVSSAQVFFTFTENTNKAHLPIKFFPPPFLSAGGSNAFFNGFEGAAASTYTIGALFDGWTVQTNQVTLFQDAAVAHSGSQFLALADGTVTQPLPTVEGHRYSLSFTYRSGSAISEILPGGPAVNPVNGHSYYLLVSNTWTVSKILARAAGGYLATINDDAENTWVADTFSLWGGDLHCLWLGLNDVAVEGTFVWDSGEPFIYEHFRSGEPNDAGGVEDYVYIYDHNQPEYPQWNDLVDTITSADQAPFSGVVEISNSGAKASIAGITNTFTGGANWQTTSIRFVATTNSTSLEFSPVNGLSGVLLDSINLVDLGSGAYVFPEESLDVLKGENAQGDWRLELWDNRVGATNPAPEVASWQLQFLFERPIPPPPPVLTNGVPGTNSIASGEFDYYRIDVPPNADFATNILLFATGPLHLWYSTNPPPFGTNVGAGDLPLLTDATNGSSIFNLTNSTPRLVPGSFYYLIVQNPNTDTNDPPVDYVIEVDFHLLPVLTNGVPITNTIDPGSLLFYFVNVPPNADYATNSLLFTTNGALNLWFTTNLPPSITNPGDILLLTNSTGGTAIFNLTNSIPLLVPGSFYFLGVQNTNAVSVGFGLQVTFHLTNAASITTNPVPPILSITYTNLGGSNGFLLTWFAPTNELFQVQWTPTLAPAVWTTFTNPPAISYKTLIDPTNSYFEFFDDGSQTGGFDPMRFYRLILVGIVGGPPATNTAPVFLTNYPPQVISVFTTLTVTNAATDAESPPQILTYAITSTVGGTNPPTINTNTGVITWTPTTADAGSSNVITTIVTDDGVPPLSATNSFVVLVDPLPAISILSVTTNGVTMQWTAPTNLQFQVEWTTNLAPPVIWTLFTDIITSTTGIFTFTDTNTPMTMKFYQLLLYP